MLNGFHDVELYEEITSIPTGPFSSPFLQRVRKNFAFVFQNDSVCIVEMAFFFKREAESELQLLVVLKV